MSDNMKAAIYTRFSSDRQTEASTHAQVRACSEYAKSNGISIYNIYSDEAISGSEEKTESRRYYQELLADVKSHRFDIILIHKYDRIARSLEEHVKLSALLKKEGIPIIAVAQNFGDGIEGDFAKQMMWILSEYYSKNLAKEVKKGHRETALKGMHNGGYAPFGYDIVEQKYVINELEAGYVKKIFNAALNCTGYQKIIRELAETGITGKRGRPIKLTQIHEILCNEKYTGTYIYCVDEETNRSDRRTKPNAIRVENAIPAIIDKNTFCEVQKIMASRKQVGKKTEYLCSGLMWCSCGAKMHVCSSTSKGHTYKYYRCGEKCGANSVRIEEADKVAADYLHTLLKEDNQKKIAFYLRSYKGHKKDCRESFMAAVSKEIRQKQREYDNILNNMSSTVFPPEVISDISQKLQRLRQEISALENAEPPEDYSVDTITDWLKSIAAAPDRKAVRLLIERIDVRSDENNTDYKVSSTLQSVLVNMVTGRVTELRAHPQNSLIILHFYGMDARVSQ